jgi:hypothetical protein
MFWVCLLEIGAADFPAGNLRRDGENRNTAAMGIIKSIDEMQVTRPAATCAHGQATRQMRFRPRGEGGRFFMPHWNRLNIIPGGGLSP